MEPRWDGDARGHGIADGRRLSPEIDAFRRTVSSPNWIAEEPEIHLLPHLRDACARPEADFALVSTERDADEIEHLVGMQAQVPNSPYVGLWTRLEGFQPSELADLISKRRAVRLGLMRNTIHVVTARDCLALYPLFPATLERALKTSPFGRNLVGVDMSAVVAQARVLLQDKPRTFSELGLLLRQRWPDRDPTSLAYVIRHLVPIVQVPPRA